MTHIISAQPDHRRLQFLQTQADVLAASPASQELAAQDVYPIRDDRPRRDAVDILLHRINAAPAVTSRPASPDPAIQALTATICLPIAELLRLVVLLAQTELRNLPGNEVKQVQGYSAFARQLALRARQLLEGPARFRATLHDPDVPLQERSRRYMSFWNTVWLVLNDLILGYCAHSFLTHSIDDLSHRLPEVIERYAAEEVESALNWLNDWPVGLKLNTPLSEFYCLSLGTFVAGWKDLAIPSIHLVAEFVIAATACASIGGLTFFLAALQDLLSFITLHLRICGMVTSAICRWQLSALSGLWNLFRGKRWNVLRQRTDSYQYDVDQLFLGTLLFTVSAFLLPTVAIYAGLFFLISTTVQALTSTLAVMRTALNSFPLFELLLRVKEPSRLPAGIHFVLRQGKDRMPYLEVMNTPKSITAILADMFRSVDREAHDIVHITNSRQA